MNFKVKVNTKMKIDKNIYYYLLTLVSYVLLKFFYSLATIDELSFLLKPTNKLVGLVLNSKAQYLSEKGYYHDELNILIDKSCSGFNFWVLCFIMLSFLSFTYLSKKKLKIIALPIVLAITYILTIAVNTSRILFSILIQKIQANNSIEKEFSWLHQAEGIFMYLFFLILIYLGFEYILKKINQNYEKLA